MIARLLRAGRFSKTSGGPLASGYVRSVGIVLSGTVLSQVITMASLPIVTRLYSPADFSLLAVFSGTVLLLATVAALRFDVALALAVDDDEARALVGLAMVSTLVLSGSGLLFAALFPLTAATLIGQPSLAKFMWIAMLGVFLTSSYATALTWATRKAQFGKIAAAKVGHAFGSAAAQVGLSRITPRGILFGQIAHPIFGMGVLLGPSVARGAKFKLPSLVQMKAALRKYWRYPTYSTVEALANSAGGQLPVIVIAASSNSADAGSLMLAMFALQGPVALIASSVSPVFLAEAPGAHVRGELSELVASTLIGLAKLGVGPLVFAAIVAPKVFPIVFGAQWYRSGALLMWLAPMFIFQYLAAPLSMALHVVGRQSTAVILQVVGIIIRTGSVTLGRDHGALPLAERFAVGSAVLYLLYLVVICVAARVSARRLYRGAGVIVTIVAAWACAGVIVRFAVNLYLARGG